MALTVQEVRELAVLDPGFPVLSLYLATDPRDPANRAATPGWVVAMRNGLREVSRQAEREGPRGERLAVREMCRRVEAAATDLDAAARARGLAWFVTADGSLDRRIALHLPLRDHLVRFGPRPFVSPLVDVADRGRPAGLVLVSGDLVRLLAWAAGRVSEPEESVYELELGRWRGPSGYAVRHPRRRYEGHEGRVQVWRQRFLREAALATGRKVAELGWQRLLLAGDRGVTGRFAEELPGEVRQRVVAEVEANLLWEEPAAVAERLERPLEAAWRRETAELAGRALRAARARDAGAMGWTEVLDALAQERVEHLVVAEGAAPDPGTLPPAITSALGDPPAGLLVERAIERAVASGAGVTVQPDGEPLAQAGGVVATLRF